MRKGELGFNLGLFLVPIIAILVAVVFTNVLGRGDSRRRSASSNQVEAVASPSGQYMLEAPIERQTIVPEYSGTPVWKITISDSAGKVLYKDEESRMVGNLMIYWGWDSRDRAWVYNSDDGRIWRWEMSDTGWTKIASTKADSVPLHILPNYAK